jgi:hypothetical protein
VLVVSQNGLRSILSLQHLENLEELRASKNKLAALSELTSNLQCWPHLRELSLQGNPVCSQMHYRERIIASSYHTLGKNQFMLCHTPGIWDGIKLSNK